MKEYSSCSLCPRNCGIDRNNTTGYCREKSSLHVARASLHMWEEPCISGSRGSGTVFFSGCNMGCVFCQNRKISRGEIGKIITWERLTEIFFELEEQGANNINLVTGDMFIPTIVKAVDRARAQGLKIPFLFNTSSYLNADSVKMLEGLIDIYLPDFKYIREEDAVRYSNAPGYVEAAKAAIQEMVRQQPRCEFTREKSHGRRDDAVYEEGQNLITKGVVVRHLLMPGMLIQGKLIVKYLHERYGDDIYLSLMSQFTPNSELSDYPEINRRVTGSEYESLITYAQNIGVTKGFIQEGEAASESFIPEFDLRGV
ncbi:radical SAM protein [Butyrivibrio sp. FCS014]|uniref:radical SAM protein n=1 Tax=Butyrivibrio sp. FCS014 TaxID=1408304 RepID=UPI000463ECB0|nr:radical SAM protein [Butyrivibrio sp. FCS014]